MHGNCESYGGKWGAGRHRRGRLATVSAGVMAWADGAAWIPTTCAPGACWRRATCG